MSSPVPPAERAAHLQQLARELRVEPPPGACLRLVTWLDAMLEENRHLNLTAIRDPNAALVLHALDALAIGRLAEQPRRCLDLGSGNGFPGVACAALWPAAEVVLLERTEKKAVALQRLADAVPIGVTVLHLDAAQVPGRLPELASAFDLITARAVGAPRAVAKLAAPLAAANAALVLWLDADTTAADRVTGHRLERIERYVLPTADPRQRRLAIYRRAAQGGR